MSDPVRLPELVATPVEEPKPFEIGPWGRPADTLATSVDLGRGTQPDTVARALKLGQRTGLPFDFISRNLDLVEREAARTDFNPEKFRAENPALAQWLENPDHAMVSGDDHTALQKIELRIRSLTNALTGGVSKSMAQYKASELGFRKVLSILGQGEALTPLQEQQWEDLNQKMDSLDIASEERKGAAAYALYQGGYSLGQQATSIYSGGKGAALGAAVGAAGGVLVGQPGLGIRVGTKIGFNLGLFDQAFEMETAFAYREYSQMVDEHGQPMDPKSAAAAALAVGAVNGMIEGAGEKVVLKTLTSLGPLVSLRGLAAKAAAKNALRQALLKPTLRRVLAASAGNWLKATAFQTAQEVVEEISVILGREAAQAASGQSFAPDEGYAQRLVDTGVQTAVGMLVAGIPLEAVHVATESRRVKRAQAVSEEFRQLGEAVKESKTNARLPQAVRDLVATAKGPVEHVFVDAEQMQTLFQSQKLSAEDLVRETMGEEGVAQFREALDLHGDLVIPLEVWATQIAPTPAGESLLEDVRLDQAEPSLREAREVEEAAKEAAKTEATPTVEGEAEQVQPDPSRPIYEAVRQQLEAAGVEGMAAEQQARVAQAIYRTLGERRGVDPMELFQRYGLEIKRSGLPEVPAEAMAQESAGPRPIRAAAVRAPDGRVFEGITHQFARDLAKDAGVRIKATDQAAAGFVTHAGRFVTREEAAKLSQAAGQSKPMPGETGLYAEDVLSPEQKALSRRRALEGPSEELSRQAAGTRLSQGPRQPYVTLQPGDLTGVRPNPLAPRVALEGATGAQGRLTRAITRQATTGSPQTGRTALRAPGEAATTVGKVTLGDWRNRVRTTLTAEEIKNARAWYGDMERLMGKVFGEERGPRVALAWLLSQQRARPSVGFLSVLRAADKVAGRPEIFQAGLNEKALVATLRGEVPAEGYGAKLLDFIDAELQRPTRTIMGDDPRGGGPAAIDVWAARDVGFVDETTRAWVAEHYGESVASRLTVDFQGGPSETQYEYGSKFYNKLARWLTAQRGEGEWGGTWQPYEAQAVGWIAMQKLMGRAAEFPADIFGMNTREIPLGLATGVGTAFYGKGEIRPAAAEQRIRDLAQATGVELLGYDVSSGAYLGEHEGNIKIRALGSPEVLADFASALGFALQQTEVISSRQMKSGKTRGVTLVQRDGASLADPQQAERFMAAVRAALPPGSHMADGYQQVVVDGQPAIRIFRNNPETGQWRGTWPKAEIEAFRLATMQVAREQGLRFRGSFHNYEVGSAHNDWTQQAHGEGYLADLVGRGRHLLAGRLRDGEFRLLPDEVGTPAERRAAGGAGLAADAGGPTVRLSQAAAFHGSPYEFDEFSLSHIGKGEGAQAYGWGLYFAGNRQVAEFYRQSLSQATPLQMAWAEVDRERDRLERAERLARQAGSYYKWIEGFDPTGKGATELRRAANSGQAIAVSSDPKEGYTHVPDSPYQKRKDRAALDLHRRWFEVARKNAEAMGPRPDKVQAGQLYRVTLAPEDDEWLLWDAPISRQSPHVLAALRGLADQMRLGPDVKLRGGGRLLAGVLAGEARTVEGKRSDDQLTGEWLYRLLAGGDRDPRAASLRLNEVGVRGIKYLDAGSRGGRAASSYNYVVFDANAVEIAQRYYQAQQQGGAGAERGFVEFGPNRRQFKITLLETADLSTFAHEMAHVYLEIAQDLATETPELTRDLATLREWMGLAPDAPISRAAHEQFARGFEAYLREGKAPSRELVGVFARFKAWLKALYQELGGLGVQLSDEVRGVFDRMLATDDEIAAQRNQQQLELELFPTPQAAGATRQEFEAYRRQRERAKAASEQALLQEVLDEEARASHEWFQAERERVRAEVARRVEGEPVYQALQYLQFGRLVGEEGTTKPLRLSRQILVDRYGEAKLKELPQPYVYQKKGGVEPDAVAAMFGFPDGDTLIDALVAQKDAPKLRDVIERETEAEMQARYPKLVDDSAALARAAQDVIHRDEQAQVLLTELMLIGRQTGMRLVGELPVVKEQARQMIATKKAREIRPFGYQQAEAKAGKRAYEAALKGDWAEAARFKRQQLLNHLLYREARDQVQAIEKAVKYLRSFNEKPARARLGKAGATYLEQVDGLLERFDLRTPTLKAAARQVALTDWIREQEAQGFQVDLPERLRLESLRTPWQELAAEEIRGLADAVKNIAHLASLKNKLLKAAKDRTFHEAVAEIVTTIGAQHEAKDETLDFTESFRKKAAQAAQGAHAVHTKPEFLFRWLDGLVDDGPIQRLLYQPIQDAESHEQVMLAQLNAQIKPILDRYTRAERVAWHKETFLAPEVGARMNKATVLSIALNWGNEENRLAVTLGYRWTDQQVTRLLERLDQRDWETVQAIWDTINGLWPDVAELQRRLTGLVPRKVEASPVKTRFGTFKGGYYPLQYDTERSTLAYERGSKASDLFEASWTRPQTRQNHTKERVGSAGQPVDLILPVFTRHLTNVIHDLTHREAVMDVDRLTRDPEVRVAIERTAGREMYKQIRPWLKRVAGGVKDPYAPGEKLIGRVRRGATAVNMGFKMTTAVTQILGFTQSIEVLGPKWTARGVSEFLHNSWGPQIEFVKQRSPMMANRQQTFDRDAYDELSRARAAGTLTRVQRAQFYLTGVMDMAVAVPTWLGAYLRGMEELYQGDEIKAIDYADGVVRRSQASGSAKDLAAIQAGNEYQRSVTMFYSYFSGTYQLYAEALARLGRSHSPTDVAKFAASMVLIWFIPAVLQDLLVARAPDDPDDPEAWAKWVAENLAAYPFSSIVGARDIARGVQWGDYDVTPLVDAGDALVRALRIPGKMFDDRDVTAADLKAVVDATGYWGHLPSRQAWITGQGLYDWMTGVDEPENPLEAARNLMFSRPPR